MNHELRIMETLKETLKLMFETLPFWAFIILFVLVLFRQFRRRKKDTTEILEVARVRGGYYKIAFSWWGLILEGCTALALFFFIWALFVPISFLMTLGGFLILAGLMLGFLEGVKKLFRK